MKNFITWIMAAIIIILSCMMNCQNKRAEEAKKNYKEFENSLSLINQKPDVRVIKLTDTVKVADVKTVRVTDNTYKSLYENLLKQINTKPKDVSSITEVGSATIGHDTTICLVDSFGGLKMNWKDNFIDIGVDIDSSRNAFIDYSIRDSLTIVSYQKKHSLLFGLIKWNSFEGCKVITHNPKSTPVTVVSYSNIKK